MRSYADKRIRAAMEAIDEAAWQPIPYWLSTPEVSGADVAEVPFTVFVSDKQHARQVRLVVRRVRPTPASQLALFTAWDYHAFVTDREGDVLENEADHRRHAVVEQTLAALKSAGLAHLPSGNFMANAAWPGSPSSSIRSCARGHRANSRTGSGRTRSSAMTGRRMRQSISTSEAGWRLGHVPRSVPLRVAPRRRLQSTRRRSLAP